METEPCELCGVAVRITKVSERCVKLISFRCAACKIPIHADEHAEYIEEEKGTYQCWNCGHKGII